MKHVNLVGKIAAIFYFLSVGGLFADTAVYRQVGGTTGGNTSYNDVENWYKPGTSPAELFGGAPTVSTDVVFESYESGGTTASGKTIQPMPGSIHTGAASTMYANSMTFKLTEGDLRLFVADVTNEAAANSFTVTNGLILDSSMTKTLSISGSASTMDKFLNWKNVSVGHVEVNAGTLYFGAFIDRLLIGVNELAGEFSSNGQASNVASGATLTIGDGLSVYSTVAVGDITNSGTLTYKGGTVKQIGNLTSTNGNVFVHGTTSFSGNAVLNATQVDGVYQDSVFEFSGADVVTSSDTNITGGGASVSANEVDGQDSVKKGANVKITSGATFNGSITSDEGQQMNLFIDSGGSLGADSVVNLTTDSFYARNNTGDLNLDGTIIIQGAGQKIGQIANVNITSNSGDVNINDLTLNGGFNTETEYASRGAAREDPSKKRNAITEVINIGTSAADADLNINKITYNSNLYNSDANWNNYSYLYGGGTSGHLNIGTLILNAGESADLGTNSTEIRIGASNANGYERVDTYLTIDNIFINGYLASGATFGKQTIHFFRAPTASIENIYVETPSILDGKGSLAEGWTGTQIKAGKVDVNLNGLLAGSNEFSLRGRSLDLTGADFADLEGAGTVNLKNSSINAAIFVLSSDNWLKAGDITVTGGEALTTLNIYSNAGVEKPETILGDGSENTMQIDSLTFVGGATEETATQRTRAYLKAYDYVPAEGEYAISVGSISSSGYLTSAGTNDIYFQNAPTAKIGTYSIGSAIYLNATGSDLTIDSVLGTQIQTQYNSTIIADNISIGSVNLGNSRIIFQTVDSTGKIELLGDASSSNDVGFKGNGTLTGVNYTLSANGTYEDNPNMSGKKYYTGSIVNFTLDVAEAYFDTLNIEGQVNASANEATKLTVKDANFNNNVLSFNLGGTSGTSKYTSTGTTTIQITRIGRMNDGKYATVGGSSFKAASMDFNVLKVISDMQYSDQLGNDLDISISSSGSFEANRVENLLASTGGGIGLRIDVANTGTANIKEVYTENVFNFKNNSIEGNVQVGNMTIASGGTFAIAAYGQNELSGDALPDRIKRYASVGGLNSGAEGSGAVYAAWNGKNYNVDGYLTINGESGTNIYSGSMYNNGTEGCVLYVTKTGESTQVLSGNNYFTGDVVVNEGTLIFNSATNGDAFAGTIYVNGGHFGSAGRLNASSIVLNGGTLHFDMNMNYDPTIRADSANIFSGNKITAESFSFANALSSVGAGICMFEFADGNLSEDLLSIINSEENGKYLYTDTVSGDMYEAMFSKDMPGYFFVTLTQVIPEPSTYAVFAGLAALAMIAFRRRSK